MEQLMGSQMTLQRVGLDLQRPGFQLQRYKQLVDHFDPDESFNFK